MIFPIVRIEGHYKCYPDNIRSVEIEVEIENKNFIDIKLKIQININIFIKEFTYVLVYKQIKHDYSQACLFIFQVCHLRPGNSNI